MKPEKPVIFFDGVCSLCNSFIDFVISRDKHHSFYVSSLQGKTAEQLLSKAYREGLGSVVYVEEGNLYTESGAVLRIFKKLGRPWSILSLFTFVPAFIRNFIYKLIAKNRYKIFGKRDSCRLPTVEEKAYFLD